MLYFVPEDCFILAHGGDPDVGRHCLPKYLLAAIYNEKGSIATCYRCPWSDLILQPLKSSSIRSRLSSKFKGSWSYKYTGFLI